MRYTPILGLLGALGAAALGQSTQPANVSIKYELDRDAKVSMLVCGADGQVVRELLHAAPQQRGQREIAWDGLDEAGQPVPAGGYTWKLLSTQGLKAEYLLTIGTNPTPRWDSWPGNHGPAVTVAADDGGMYVATGCGEGTILALKQTLDGKRIWTIPHWLEAWGGPTSMASDNGTLYMLHLSGKVFRTPVDKAAPVDRPWDLVFEDDRKASVFSEVSNIMDMDAGGGQLVISYTRQNLLRWIDQTDGKEVDRVEVQRPSGVAVDRSDGSVLVISEGQVLRLSRADKTPKLVIARDQLCGARRLSVNPHSGEILITENRGTQAWVDYQYFSDKHDVPDSDRARMEYYRKRTTPGGDATRGQQVKRFSRDGKLLAAYGAPAGRRYGAYNPNDFSGLYDIAAMADGGFLIGEEGNNKRIALFDKEGRLVREWCGGWGYGQFAMADPQDASIVWVANGTLFLKTKVDYAAKNWKLLATYDASRLSEMFGENGQYWRILRHGGMTYLARYGSTGGLGPVILKVDDATGTLVPMVVANVNTGQDPHLKLAWASYPTLAEALKDKSNNSSNLWVDRNGDGLSSVAEYSFSPWYTHGAGFYVVDDFTYYFHGQDDALKAVAFYQLPVREWTAAGVPVYDFKDLKVIGKSPIFTESVWRDQQGSLFSLTNSAGLGAPGFGVGFWSPRASANRVSKWTADGKPIWTVGRHAASRVAAPGEAKYLYTFTGMAHGCIVANDVEEGMLHAWDQDGLWVGRLLESPVIGPESPKSAYELCGENFGGSLHTDPKTGEVLFFGGAVNNVPVYRISGWDQFQRQRGSVTVSPEVAGQLHAKAQAEAARKDVIHIGYLDRGQVKIDGDLAEWKSIKPVIIEDGKTQLARVYVAWTADGLVAAFDVTTKSPWKSAGNEQLPFQGGAAVDINIAPLSPDAKNPLDGQARYVVAPISGKTTLVEIMPILGKDMSPPHSMREVTYKTMIGSITYQRSVALGGANWSSVKEKPDGTGYVVEMRIASHSPHAYRPGYRFRFDASVILANPEGTNAVLRIPWHSRQADDMAVQDTYTEGRLRPQNWGEAVLE